MVGAGAMTQGVKIMEMAREQLGDTCKLNWLLGCMRRRDIESNRIAKGTVLSLEKMKDEG